MKQRGCRKRETYNIIAEVWGAHQALHHPPHKLLTSSPRALVCLWEHKTMGSLKTKQTDWICLLIHSMSTHPQWMNEAEELEICLIRNSKGVLAPIFAWATRVSVWTTAFNNGGSQLFIWSIDFHLLNQESWFSSCRYVMRLQNILSMQETQWRELSNPSWLYNEKDSLNKVCSRG